MYIPIISQLKGRDGRINWSDTLQLGPLAFAVLMFGLKAYLAYWAYCQIQALPNQERHLINIVLIIVIIFA